MSARGGGAGPSAPRGATETKATEAKTTETKTTTPLELHRFPDWRALRGFALREAEAATPDRSVALIVPTEGAAWVLDRFLRSELPLGAVAPFVTTAARAFGDLLDDARDDTPDDTSDDAPEGDPNDAPAGAAPASRLMRETVLEEALAAGAEGEGAPPGAPELLAEPLLAFLDEQAADRSPTPGEEEEAAAFEVFCDRVEPVFSEESATDRGAARLAALTGWLRGVVRRYRNGLRERGRLDPEGVRRELVRQAESVRAARRWTRVVALGEGALKPADAEVFAALAPPEGLAWALPPGAPTPALPPSLRPIDRAIDRPAAERVGDRPGSLFAPAATAERLTVFAPEPAADTASGTPDAPDSPAPWVFVVTDRDDEVESAIRLLETFRDESPERFRGFDRCAIAARKPALYLPAAESAFAGAGIPFRTPEAAPLVAEPWAAGLGDLLDFAERPEQLSRGLTLLRNPFLTAPDLPAPPPLSADRAERAFLRGVPTARPRAAADPGEPALFRVGLRDTLTVPAGQRAPAAGASEAASPSDPAPTGSDPARPRASDSGSDDSAPPGGIADSLRALAGRCRQAAPAGESAPGNHRKKDSPRRMAETEDDAAAAAVLERLADWADDLAPFRDPGADLGEAVSAVVEFVRARFSPEVPERREAPDSAEEPVPTDLDAPSGPREPGEESALVALVQAADSLKGVSAAGGRERVADLLRRLLRRRKAPRRRADEGVQLVRAEDAPFGDFDGLVVLGLSDADWPGPRPSNIFYPQALLEPATRERHADRRAAEVRLLRAFAESPRRTAAFVRAAHEDGFPAGVSPFEVELREALETGGARRRTLAPPAVERAARRGNGSRPAPDPLPAALDRRAPSAKALERTLSPSALDRYADSPAEFFARNVLYLDEERQLSDIAPPTERGLLLHEVLERGIPRLHQAGIAVETAPERALDLLDDTLREIARRWQLPTDDLRSERLWLFGHAAEPGALEWFLREQAAQGPFEPRNYEKELVAEIEPATAAALPLKIAGRADRVDTLPDGRLRVLEYKSGRFFSKPLQARLYARLLEAGGSAAPVYGIAYLGDRRWIGPDDKPSDSDQDETIRAIRDRLAVGDFGRPRNEPTFGMPLVSRHDLPEAAPDGSEEPGAPDPGPGVR